MFFLYAYYSMDYMQKILDFLHIKYYDYMQKVRRYHA